MDLALDSIILEEEPLSPKIEKLPKLVHNSLASNINKRQNILLTWSGNGDTFFSTKYHQKSIKIEGNFEKDPIKYLLTRHDRVWSRPITVNSSAQLNDTKKNMMYAFHDVSTSKGSQVDDFIMEKNDIDVALETLQQDLEIAIEMASINQQQNLKNNIHKVYRRVHDRLKKLAANFGQALQNERKSRTLSMEASLKQLEVQHQVLYGLYIAHQYLLGIS